MHLHGPAVGEAGDLGKVLLALLALAGCTSRTVLDEGTIAAIGPGGGIATSADTFFELRFPPGALAADTRISITTDRVTRVASVFSPIYRVEPADLALSRPVIASYRAGDAAGVVWVGRRALGTTREDVFTALPTSEVTPDYERQNHVARGEVSSLAQGAFALAELNETGTCAAEACGLPCGGCTAADRGCMPDPDGNVCNGSGACERPSTSCPTQGWDHPPSSGAAFVVSDLVLVGSGFGGSLTALGNDLIRNAILGGELLLVAELAGLDYVITFGEDPHLTFKLYEAVDGDGVFFPANNFAGPDCCKFLVRARSLAGSQAEVRSPARLSGGVIANVGVREGPRLAFPFFVGSTATPLENMHFALAVSSSSNALEGTLGGVLGINSLGNTPNPYCVGESNPLCPSGRVNSTLLDLFANDGPANVDIDGDGLERVVIGPDGRASRCVDGDGSEVSPLVFGAPESCGGRPEMADAYGLTYAVKMVPATIVGVQE